MGNHNILITNPQGDRKNQFFENVSLDQCKKWLEEYGPAPVGWHYQITNRNKNPRKYPSYILVQGFNAEDKLIAQVKTSIKHNNGHWYSPKMAKRDLRARGAIRFTREKVWDNDEQPQRSKS